MQYILTEQEYYTLKHNHEEKIALGKEELLTLCIKAANEWPIVRRGFDNPTVWGCILDESGEQLRTGWYCDQCPVETICPYEHKRFSK